MGNILDILARVFVGPPVDWPFDKDKGEARIYDLPPVEPEEDVSAQVWGDKIKNVRKAETEEGTISWEVATDQPGRLKPSDLDSFDWAVIRSEDLNPNNFKLCKPYVLAQLAGEKINYQEIGLVLGFSESWVQRIAPRIKAAARERAKASTPTPG